MQEKKRKDYTFWRQLNEKPSIIPGCPGKLQCNTCMHTPNDKSLPQFASAAGCILHLHLSGLELDARSAADGEEGVPDPKLCSEHHLDPSLCSGVCASS